MMQVHLGTVRRCQNVGLLKQDKLALRSHACATQVLNLEETDSGMHDIICRGEGKEEKTVMKKEPKRLCNIIYVNIE